MNINVKINKLIPEGNIKAYASINFDNCFAVTGLKVMDGSKGMFVSMPSYKSGNEYKEVAFPLSKEMRTQLNQVILKEYDKALALEQSQGHSQQKPNFSFGNNDNSNNNQNQYQNNQNQNNNNNQNNSNPNYSDDMDDFPYEMNMN